MPTTEELSQAAYDFLDAVISFIKMRRNALLIMIEALPQQTNCGDEVATYLHQIERSYAEWVIDAAAVPENMERWFNYSEAERTGFYSHEAAQLHAQKTFLEIEPKEKARCIARGEASKAYRRSKALQGYTFITLCLMVPLIFIFGVVMSKSLWVAIGIAVVLGIVWQALHRYADKRTKNDLQKLQSLTPSQKQPAIDAVVLLRKVQERYHPHLHSARPAGAIEDRDGNEGDFHHDRTGEEDDDEHGEEEPDQEHLEEEPEEQEDATPARLSTFQIAARAALILEFLKDGEPPINRMGGHERKEQHHDEEQGEEQQHGDEDEEEQRRETDEQQHDDDEQQRLDNEQREEDEQQRLDDEQQRLEEEDDDYDHDESQHDDEDEEEDD